MGHATSVRRRTVLAIACGLFLSVPLCKLASSVRFAGTVAVARLETGYSLALGETGARITPYVAPQPMQVWQGGATGSFGAIGGGLRYDAASITALPAYLGAQLDAQWQPRETISLSPFPRVALSRNSSGSGMQAPIGTSEEPWMSDIAVGPDRSPFVSLGGSLRRSRRAMLIAFLGTTVVFGGAAFLMPPSYRANSVLMVRLGQEYLVNGDPASTTMFEEREQLFVSEAAMLETPQLAMQVIDEIGLARIYPSLADSIDAADPNSAHDAMERATDKFERHLRVRPVKDSTLYEVDFTNGDPQVAADVLKQTVADYLQNRRQHFEYGNRGALGGQVLQTMQEVQSKLAALETLKSENAITDITRQMAALFDRKTDLTRLKDQADLDIVGETARIAALAPITADMPPAVQRVTTQPGPAQLAAREEAARLRLRRNELSIGFKPDTPQIEDVTHQIVMAESLMRHYGEDEAMQTVTARPGSYDTLITALAQSGAQRDASTERARVAAAKIADVDGVIGRLNDQQLPVEQKSHELQAALDAFYQASRRVSEAKAHDDMMETAKPNVEVIQEARPPFEETWLRATIAAAGVVLGLMLAGTILYVNDVRRGWRTQ